MKDLLLHQNPNLSVEIIEGASSRDFRGFDFVYNGTGLGKFNSSSPIADGDLFNRSGIAFDANYTPAKTPFLETMEAHGYEGINGLSHMIMCTTLHLLATSPVTAFNSNQEPPAINFEMVQECYEKIA